MDYVTLANDVVNKVKAEVERFKTLKSTLNVKNQEISLKMHDLSNTVKGSQINESQQQSLLIEINSLTNERINIENQLSEIRTNINNQLLQTINDLLSNPDLNSNEKNFLSLIAQMLKIANLKDVLELELIDDVMFISANEKMQLQALMEKTDLFKSIRTVKNAETKPLNKQMIDRIKAELNRIEGNLQKEVQEARKAGKRTVILSSKADNEQKVLPQELNEYNNLLAILKYLTEAKNQQVALSNVWDMFYVDGSKREEFIQLLDKTKYFKNYKLNGKLIEELRDYLKHLDSLEQQNNDNQEIEEKNKVGAIIDLLQENSDSFAFVENIAYVPEGKQAEFLSLASSCKFHDDKSVVSSNFANNDKIISENAALIANLTDRATGYNSHYCTTYEGYTVLAGDIFKLRALVDANKILESAKDSTDLAVVEKTLVASNRIDEYQEAMKAAQLPLCEPPKLNLLPKKTGVRKLMAKAQDFMSRNKKRLMKTGLAQSLSELRDKITKRNLIKTENEQLIQKYYDQINMLAVERSDTSTVINMKLPNNDKIRVEENDYPEANLLLRLITILNDGIKAVDYVVIRDSISIDRQELPIYVSYLEQLNGIRKAKRTKNVSGYNDKIISDYLSQLHQLEKKVRQFPDKPTYETTIRTRKGESRPTIILDEDKEEFWQLDTIVNILFEGQKTFDTCTIMKDGAKVILSSRDLYRRSVAKLAEIRNKKMEGISLPNEIKPTDSLEDLSNSNSVENLQKIILSSHLKSLKNELEQIQEKLEYTRDENMIDKLNHRKIEVENKAGLIKLQLDALKDGRYARR